jgi:hypothetical protein
LSGPEEQPARNPLLVLEEPTLAVDPAGIAGEVASRTDDPVARHDHREGVGAVGAADRADGGSIAQRAGLLPVRAGL